MADATLTVLPPSRARIWLVAVRPFSFTTSTVPVLAASALALFHGDLDPLALLLMLIASMATHAGCNLANDLYDDRSGVDRVQTVGHGGALQRGWLTRRELTLGVAVAFAVALIAALPIMVSLGRPIVLIAIASAAAAYLYTGGPFPLAYWALGELTVFLAMGVGMVAGSYYVHTGAVSLSAWLLGSAIGLIAAAILHANNVRDIDVDRAHRKRTVANLLGRAFATHWFSAQLMAAWVLLALLILFEPASWPIALAAVALPLTLTLIRAMAAATTVPQLDRLLRRTAGLHLRVGLLVTAGYLLAALIGRWT